MQLTRLACMYTFTTKLEPVEQVQFGTDTRSN